MPLLFAQHGVVTGQNGTAMGQNGMITGQNGIVMSQNGMLTGQNGMITGQNGMVTGQNGMVMGQNGVVMGQNGMVTGQNGMVLGQNSGIMGQKSVQDRTVMGHNNGNVYSTQSQQQQSLVSSSGTWESPDLVFDSKVLATDRAKCMISKPKSRAKGEKSTRIRCTENDFFLFVLQWYISRRSVLPQPYLVQSGLELVLCSTA